MNDYVYVKEMGFDQYYVYNSMDYCIGTIRAPIVEFMFVPRPAMEFTFVQLQRITDILRDLNQVQSLTEENRSY